MRFDFINMRANVTMNPNQKKESVKKFFFFHVATLWASLRLFFRCLHQVAVNVCNMCCYQVQHFFDSQSIFGLPASVVGATLGGLGVVQVTNISQQIPRSLAVGVDECLVRCGLKGPHYVLG